MNRRARAFAALALSPLLSGCGGDPEPPVAATVPVVRTVAVRTETFTPLFESFGSISFLHKADIRPMAEGEIVTLLAEEADQVSRERPLARLDDAQLQIRLLQAHADLDSAEASLTLARGQLAEGERQIEARLLAVENARLDLSERERSVGRLQSDYQDTLRLYEAGGVPEDDLEEAENRLVTAQVALERAKNELALRLIGLRDVDMRRARIVPPVDPAARSAALVELNTATLRAQVEVAQAAVSVAEAEVIRVEQLIEEMVIRSPISGVVASRYVEVGERATPEAPLFTVIDASRVYADVQVSETELGTLSPGQSARVVVDSIGIEQVGEIVRISPILSAQTRSGRVRILIPEPDARLRPGMFATVRVETGEPRSVLAIDDSAIVELDDGTTVVFVVENGVVFQTPIESTHMGNGRAAINGGLSRGERVVAVPHSALRDGMRVEAVQ